MSECIHDKVKVRTDAPIGVEMNKPGWRMMQRYRAERVGLDYKPMVCDAGCPYHRYCEGAR